MYANLAGHSTGGRILSRTLKNTAPGVYDLLRGPPTATNAIGQAAWIAK
jgi:hypothetical protein